MGFDPRYLKENSKIPDVLLLIECEQFCRYFRVITRNQKIKYRNDEEGRVVEGITQFSLFL